MTEQSNITNNKEFLKTQELNSINQKLKKSLIVNVKPVSLLDIQNGEQSAAPVEKQTVFTEDISEVLSNNQEKGTDVFQNEILKLHLQNINKLENFRYKKDYITIISFFSDVDSGPRSTLIDSVLVTPFLTSFKGPFVEKQMKQVIRETTTKQSDDDKRFFSKVEHSNNLGSNFSGFYITMWMIFGWTILHGMMNYLLLNNWRYNDIPLVNLMTERLYIVLIIDLSMWLSSYIVVLIQSFIKWNLLSWESTGRYFTITFEIVYFYFFHFLVIDYFKMNWISRIFFFLHCLVYIMKMHSFSFYNGYLWNITHEAAFSKWALSKYKNSVPSSVLAALQRSRTFCEYELSTQSSTIEFPANICFKNYTLFCLYPTLVYQIDYPRSKNIKWMYVFQKFCAIIGVLCLMIITSQLYLYPYIANTINITSSGGWPDLWTSIIYWFCLLVDVLPGFSIIFLLTFYFIWDALLNFVAELTQFTDRYFYGDWWNCVSFSEWSRIWNVPVHKFLLRHIFHSSMKHWKFSSTTATWVTFGLSSMLHEFSMYVIFLKVRPYMFLFQMSQIPTTYLSKRTPFKENPALCNILFIFAIYIGMTTILCLYLVY